MRISTIMPVTSMPSTTHIGKLMAASRSTLNAECNTAAYGAALTCCTECNDDP